MIKLSNNASIYSTFNYSLKSNIKTPLRFFSNAIKAFDVLDYKHTLEEELQHIEAKDVVHPF